MKTTNRSVLPTGLRDLDAMIGGLHPGDLVLVAGRPATGKTTLGIHLALHAAGSLRRGVVYFSMEMTSDSLTKLMFGIQAGVDRNYCRKSTLLEVSDYQRLVAAASLLNSSPMYVDDSPNLTVGQMARKTKGVEHQYGNVGLVVVDYLELMGVGKTETVSWQQALRTRVEGLKDLATDLGIPVVVLGKLDRQVVRDVQGLLGMAAERKADLEQRDAELKELYRTLATVRRVRDLIRRRHQQLSTAGSPATIELQAVLSALDKLV